MGRLNNLLKDNKRFAAGIMAMMLLFAMLFSVFFLSVEAGHECDNGDCPICACMQQCSNTIHVILKSNNVAVATIIPIIYYLSLRMSFLCDRKTETLVSIKVRLDN